MSLHADALAVLEGWVAPTPAQEALRTRYVEHLRAHADGVWRDCFPDHLTAGTVARREALEESGLDALDFDPVPAHLDEHAVGFCDPRGEVHHLDVRFVARAPRGAEHAVSEESLDVRWWPVDALPDLEAEMHDLVAIARERFARPGTPAQSTLSPGGSSSSAAADQPSR